MRLARSRREALDQFGTAIEERFSKRGGQDAAPDGASDTDIDSAQGGTPNHNGKRLGELLVGHGHLSETELEAALVRQTETGARLGQQLIDTGALAERTVVDALAEQLQLGVIDLSRAELSDEVVSLLDEDLARTLHAIPVSQRGQRVQVAVSDPLLDDLEPKLIEALQAPISLLVAGRSEVEMAIDRSYTSQADIDDALRLFEERFEARKRDAQVDEIQLVDENAPVVKVVNLILEQAVRDRASDIHVEPMEDRIRIRVRTDGALHEVMSLPAAMGASLLSRIKVMADMNIVERRRPQDGQLEATVAGRELDVRVATSPTVFGEKCVLRLLDRSRALYRLPELGMPNDTFEVYNDIARAPYGMLICAGPTGSGKTTTLYATLSAINNEEINVVTIEDPVEYVFPSINQIQINEQAGVTFANGLRAILRQDPDAILVGEIRDVETARIAVQAALTGHFVMSSLHATDTISALHRFLDMGIENFLIASSLLGVVGQRLVRRVCPHCTSPYEPTADELAFYRKSGGDPDKTEFVHGTGCNFCGKTGYFERIGVYEVLQITDEFKELIVNNAPHAELRALAISQGMRTLRDQAVRLVTDDETTIAEVLRTVYVL